MVEFCSKCDAIIIGKKGEKATCPACGHSQKAKEEIVLSEKIAKKEEKEVLTDNNETNIHPIIDAECMKCKNKKAYYWTKQTRAADEPETMFFKCTKCKQQWREYR